MTSNKGVVRGGAASGTEPAGTVVITLFDAFVHARHRSTQKQQFQSFLGATTIGEAHSAVASTITTCSNMVCTREGSKPSARARKVSKPSAEAWSKKGLQPAHCAP